MPKEMISEVELFEDASLDSPIIFLPFLTDEWIKNANNLHSRLTKAGKFCRIIEVSDFSFPKRIDIDKREIFEAHPHIETLEKSRRFDLGNLKLELDIEELSQSCQQSLKSLSRFENPPRFSPMLYLSRKIMFRRAMKLWHLLCSSKGDLDQKNAVLIPNGRFPVDVVLASFFRQIGARTMFWEMDASHTGYFVSDWEIHRWSKATKSVGHYISKNLDDVEKADWSKAWLSSRQWVTSNPFSEYWSTDRSRPIIESKSAEKLAVFFSSSSDELGAIPANELAELCPQHLAARLQAQWLESNNFRLVIRIHPNLLNKPIRQFVREFQAFKGIARDFKNVQIIPPWASTNSYDLLTQADLVLVHGSTIGLEASALGKRVITTQRTAYSQVIDVIEILEPKDYVKLKLESKECDPRKALAYIEYLHRHKVIRSIADKEFQHLKDLSLSARMRILFRDPLDTLAAIWFNFQWRGTKLLLNFWLKFARDLD